MSARLIPVELSFSGEKAQACGWGRFLELSAGGAIVTTRSGLNRHDSIYLTFEVSGEKFKAMPAVVTHEELDDDGYVRAEIRFTDEVEKRRLARTLLEVLSR